MASSSMENITNAMNNVLLDDEEEGGIAIMDGDEGGISDAFSIGDSRQAKMIGAKWLRNGEDDTSGKEGAGGNTVSGEKSIPRNQEMSPVGGKDGDSIAQNMAGGEISGNLKTQSVQVGGNIFKNKGVTVLENKKRRTESGFENPMGLNTELSLDSDGDNDISMDQDANDVPKNLFGAGSVDRARQSS
ncbi:hypothetical protein POM88_004310 [Heracleum sosnowskyi]|uniref:Uncharacterized protein n=1 Tax=Heracleum sosnowskyi TaxID=360622 RepID=A0AAD8JHM4_9APIA|nr:hypothetical protein POM88_004310 [Heracleum sosnowskyi]